MIEKVQMARVPRPYIKNISRKNRVSTRSQRRFFEENHETPAQPTKNLRPQPSDQGQRTRTHQTMLDIALTPKNSGIHFDFRGIYHFLKIGAPTSRRTPSRGRTPELTYEKSKTSSPQISVSTAAIPRPV